MARKMMDYVELTLYKMYQESDLDYRRLGRRVGKDAGTISRHFMLEASYAREGGDGNDRYIEKMAKALGTTSDDVWTHAVRSYVNDPKGVLPAVRKRQVVRTRAQRAPRRKSKQF